MNKVCASGLKAVALASMSIQLGISDVVVAGAPARAGPGQMPAQAVAGSESAC